MRKNKVSPISVILVVVGGLVALMGVDYAFSMVPVGNALAGVALEADGKVGGYTTATSDSGFFGVEAPTTLKGQWDKCTGSVQAVLVRSGLYMVKDGAAVVQRVVLMRLFHYTGYWHRNYCSFATQNVKIHVKVRTDIMKGVPSYATISGVENIDQASEFLAKAEELERKCRVTPVGEGGCSDDWPQRVEELRRQAGIKRIPAVCRNETSTIADCSVELGYVPKQWGDPNIPPEALNAYIYVDLYTLPPEGSIFQVEYTKEVVARIGAVSLRPRHVAGQGVIEPPSCPEGTSANYIPAFKHMGEQYYEIECSVSKPILVLVKAPKDFTVKTTFTTATSTTWFGTQVSTFTTAYQTTVPNLIIQTINNPTTITLQAFQKTHTLTIVNPAEQAQQLAKEYSPQPRKPLLWIVTEWFKNIFNTLMKFITGA